MEHPHALIQTELEDIDGEIFVDRAPITAANFLCGFCCGFWGQTELSCLK